MPAAGARVRYPTRAEHEQLKAECFILFPAVL
jgi:hypothetical protein